MRVGIFGGSFNPPHKMHIFIVEELVKQGFIDKVILVAAGDTYEKSGLVSYEHRSKMVEMAISHNENLVLSDIGNDPYYQMTYRILAYYQNMLKDDEIFYILGSDNLNEFDTWDYYEYIFENFNLLVIKRNNDDIEEILKKYEKYKDKIIVANVSSKPISSTLVRDSLKNNDKCDFLIDEVQSYIKENNLFSGELCRELSKD